MLASTILHILANIENTMTDWLQLNNMEISAGNQGDWVEINFRHKDSHTGYISIYILHENNGQYLISDWSTLVQNGYKARADELISQKDFSAIHSSMDSFRLTVADERMLPLDVEKMVLFIQSVTEDKSISS